MKSAFRLIVLILLLGGWGLAASALHVVRTPTKLLVITKNQLGITDTYVDTRAWKAEDVTAHPVVVKRLIELDKLDSLGQVVENQKGDLKSQLLDLLNKAIEPASNPPAKTGKK